MCSFIYLSVDFLSNLTLESCRCLVAGSHGSRLGVLLGIPDQVLREELIVLLLEPLTAFAFVTLDRLLLHVLLSHVLVLIETAQQDVLVVHISSLYALL